MQGPRLHALVLLPGPSELEADLGAFVDSLSLKRVIVVEHSSATLVARRYAVHHRIASLVSSCKGHS
jgi:pimeloyl-ACP methyl ester carboxylesterase